MEERRYKSTRASSAKPDVSIKSLLKTTKDGPHTTSERASSRSTWWVAYVEEDAYGGDRILDVYRWDR